MSARFIRKTEDFICEHCGSEVVGNGYTNHCPQCLFSKHVDVSPGDRKANCGGLMRPIAVEIRRKDKIILHECLRCGHRKPNKSAVQDNFEEIVRILSACAK